MANRNEIYQYGVFLGAWDEALREAAMSLAGGFARGKHLVRQRRTAMAHEFGPLSDLDPLATRELRSIALYEARIRSERAQGRAYVTRLARQTRSELGLEGSDH